MNIKTNLLRARAKRVVAPLLAFALILFTGAFVFGHKHVDAATAPAGAFHLPADELAGLIMGLCANYAPTQVSILCLRSTRRPKLWLRELHRRWSTSLSPPTHRNSRQTPRAMDKIPSPSSLVQVSASSSAKADRDLSRANGRLSTASAVA